MVTVVIGNGGNSGNRGNFSRAKTLYPAVVIIPWARFNHIAPFFFLANFEKMAFHKSMQQNSLGGVAWVRGIKFYLARKELKYSS